MWDRGALYDVRTGLEGLNPILNVGYPRCIEGIEAADALFYALGISLELRFLDRDLFFHRYDMQCSEAEPTIAIWDMPVKDVSGQEAKIPVYLTPGSGFLLLSNEILHQSRLLGPENLLVIPAGVRGISRKELKLQTYSEPVSLEDKNARRTYLFAVPSKKSKFKA